MERLEAKVELVGGVAKDAGDLAKETRGHVYDELEDRILVFGGEIHRQEDYNHR